MTTQQRSLSDIGICSVLFAMLFCAPQVLGAQHITKCKACPQWEYAELDVAGDVGNWTAGDSVRVFLNATEATQLFGVSTQSLPKGHDGEIITKGAFAAILNALGSAGWELLAVWQGRSTTYYFKRPK